MRLRNYLIWAAVLSLAGSDPARAAEDPAASRVEAFCGGLLEAVKVAKDANAQVRARKLQPLVEQNFNLEAMAQFTIGEPWTRMSAADHAALVSALTRYMAARYAREFESYSGQRCVVDPLVATRGPDKLVKSQVVEGGDSTSVNYRLREYGGAWKVIDVFYRGVSQLATQRSDFGAAVQSGGAASLVAKLNELTAKLR